MNKLFEGPNFTIKFANTQCVLPMIIADNFKTIVTMKEFQPDITSIDIDMLVNEDDVSNLIKLVTVHHLTNYHDLYDDIIESMLESILNMIPVYDILNFLDHPELLRIILQPDVLPFELRSHKPVHDALESNFIKEVSKKNFNWQHFKSYLEDIKYHPRCFEIAAPYIKKYILTTIGTTDFKNDLDSCISYKIPTSSSNEEIIMLHNKARIIHNYYDKGLINGIHELVMMPNFGLVVARDEPRYVYFFEEIPFDEIEFIQVKDTKIEFKVLF